MGELIAVSTKIAVSEALKNHDGPLSRIKKNKENARGIKPWQNST